MCFGGGGGGSVGWKWGSSPNNTSAPDDMRFKTIIELFVFLLQDMHWIMLAGKPTIFGLFLLAAIQMARAKTLIPKVGNRNNVLLCWVLPSPECLLACRGNPEAPNRSAGNLKISEDPVVRQGMGSSIRK